MKHILTFLAVALLFIAGCNSPAPKADEQKAAAPPPPAKAAFTPYKARLVELTVKDYDKWYDGFKAHDSLPKAYGLTNPYIARELDNDKKVIVLAAISDVQKAKDFDNLPARKDNMKKGGVTDAGTPTYWNVVMDDTSKIPQHERVMVVHHVKDFDTWKKAFDKEGIETRKANGFYERALARGVEDPNMVAIIFAITDMQKQKARMSSPGLKKIMEDGGVDGTPQFTYFKWVNM